MKYHTTSLSQHMWLTKPLSRRPKENILDLAVVDGQFGLRRPDCVWAIVLVTDALQVSSPEPSLGRIPKEPCIWPEMGRDMWWPLISDLSANCSAVGWTFSRAGKPSARFCREGWGPAEGLASWGLCYSSAMSRRTLRSIEQSPCPPLPLISNTTGATFYPLLPGSRV